MDVGELLLQALLSMLCGALMVMWVLKTCVVPAGTSVFEIQNSIPNNINIGDEQIDKEVTPP